jgi:hypothetical protein
MSISKSIWNEVDEMPNTFEEKKALSESFLKRALEGLLVEGRARNVLTAPYGRPIQPTPLVDLTKFLKDGGLDEPTDGSINDDPVFIYDYGFDPLQYLADYLRFLHPRNIRDMKDERVAAVERLQFRAAHSKKIQNNFEQLSSITEQIRSGILWGPFTTPATSPSSSLTAVICACGAVRDGDLIIEISKDSNFTVIDNTWTHEVTNKDVAQKLLLSDLDYGVKYFLRCCLRDKVIPPTPLKMDFTSSRPSSTRAVLADSLETDTKNKEVFFRGPVEGFFQHTQFIACPVDEEIDVLPPSRQSRQSFDESLLSPLPQAKPVHIVALNVSSSHLSTKFIKDMDAADDCFVSCLLGEVFSRPVGKSRSVSRLSGYFRANSDTIDSENSEWCKKQTFDLHRHSELFSQSDSVLRNSSILLAWHDRSLDSDLWLYEEEG